MTTNGCWISLGEWFDYGTETLLIEKFTDEFGLFEGIRNGEVDQETCRFDEFWSYHFGSDDT